MFLYRDYYSKQGENWEKRENGILDLFDKMAQEYPSFYISYFPIIYYSKYYNTTDPKKIIQLSKHNSSFDKSLIPTLDFINFVKTKHDIVNIRKQLIYNRSGDATLSYVSDSYQDKYQYIFNVASNTFMPINDLFYFIKDYINDVDSIEKIINKIAIEKSLDNKILFIKLHLIFMQYKNILKKIVL
ncbi:MAG: hypothetical protein ABF289_11540 [Clostridiales bacterium]